MSQRRAPKFARDDGHIGQVEHGPPPEVDEIDDVTTAKDVEQVARTIVETSATNHRRTTPSRDFTFSPAPKILLSVRVFTTVAGMLTLTDNQGQTISAPVAVNSLQSLATGWTLGSTTVTVAFTGNDALGLDDIAYRSP